jgi:hypothetical protein
MKGGGKESSKPVTRAEGREGPTPAATQPEELCLEKSRGNYLKEDKKTHGIKRGGRSKERQMGMNPHHHHVQIHHKNTHKHKQTQPKMPPKPSQTSHNSSPPPPLRKT